MRPSLIRVEAGEVTYHFHIYIRFLVETNLLEGNIKVEDLPAFWNEQFKNLLGIKVPNYREGVLQDVHWSLGYIGYFPTYSMGTVISMQLAQKLEKQTDSIDKLVTTKEGIKQIIEFLKENIQKYGGVLPPEELVEQTVGKYLDTQVAVEYLRRKSL